MSSHLYPPNSSEEMKNEKQEKERLQGELKQMVEKYSVLLQRLLEREKYLMNCLLIIKKIKFIKLILHIIK